VVLAGRNDPELLLSTQTQKSAKAEKAKRKKPSRWRSSNPDFRHRAHLPAPPAADIENRLRSVLTPALFAPGRMPGTWKLRNRLLTLPAVMALVVSLVWRQIPSLAEALRVLAREGLLWQPPLQVSRQALWKRLARLPVAVFASLLDQVIHSIQNSQRDQPPPAPSPTLALVCQHFSSVWIADGSTLEALKKKLAELKDQPLRLGGKIMMVVDAWTRQPIKTFYTADAQANDKTFSDSLIPLLPVGGLLIFDLGFFSFPFFDAFQPSKYFLTRLREKTAFRVVSCLSQGPRYRDEIIRLGLTWGYPCTHQLRLVSILWNQTWYQYLTNVLDPQKLSARQVGELYRRRWRIEEAFLLTKRLLGLAYLWVGGCNGVQIQIYATWIFYAVLVDVCRQVAVTLAQPLDRISVEMVYRSFYHFSRAVEKDPSTDLIAFLTTHAKLFGLVKAVTKRQRMIQQQLEATWAPP
jgi:Transposase DDE domain